MAIQVFKPKYRTEEVLKEIAKWRYDNGYIIRSSLDWNNFTASRGED